MFKMRCGIPNAYILDVTMYKMHVSLYSYSTIGTVSTEIQPLNTGDKSLKVRQEYVNLGKISLNKRNITA